VEQWGGALESVVVESGFKSYDGKKVLVTGHTGFKGSWLCLWLNQLGAKVSGYALEPPTSPSLYQDAGIEELLSSSTRSDVRDLAALAVAVDLADPDIIFHLAAQSLVRASYKDPVETFSTNIIGTVNLLETVRRRKRPCVVIVVTSDKCYANTGQVWGYRECDPMGGDDPYSASKGAAELVVHGYRQSFFLPDSVQSHGVKLATARAGNVIGGGDWAKDRIVPDIIRSISQSETVKIRNPDAVRPWQHVLEPLAGYLNLGQNMLQSDDPSLIDGWNFGPGADDCRPVQELVNEVFRHWPGTFDVDSRTHPEEAGYLTLSSEKARKSLGWRPRWSFSEAVRNTVRWYRNEEQICARQRCEADLWDFCR